MHEVPEIMPILCNESKYFYGNLSHIVPKEHSHDCIKLMLKPACRTVPNNDNNWWLEKQVSVRHKTQSNAAGETVPESFNA